MGAIRRLVPEDLRPEVAHVQPADFTRAHRAVAARRRPHPAVPAERDASDGGEAAAEVRVLAVELDGAVEAADPRERILTNGEIAAVENGADAERLVDAPVRRRRHHHVVHPDERGAAAMPIVEAIRSGRRHEIALSPETAFDALEPPDGRAAVG